MPVSLLDVLIFAVAVRGSPSRHGTCCIRQAGPARRVHIVARTVVWAAVLYLLFLALWGLNYRRPRLSEKLTFDALCCHRRCCDACRAARRSNV